MRGKFHFYLDKLGNTFHKFDSDGNGTLDAEQLGIALSEIMDTEVLYEQIDILLREFNKSGNGKLDISEFVMMMVFFEEYTDDDDNFSDKVKMAVAMSKNATNDLLCEVSKKINPIRNILCIQTKQESSLQSKADCQVMNLDEDFTPAFSAVDMRCLALVAHDQMKATMKEFVITNKNILKKFRLTGTMGTMTMLKEVFKDVNGVIYGPTCEYESLGGNAELVGLLCGGRLGGILYFQDPMSSHTHQSDIDCLCRQALVHNTMLANTPTSAYMMMQVFRSALEGDGKPELIPSFFFSLQSPVVAGYRSSQMRFFSNHSSHI